MTNLDFADDIALVAGDDHLCQEMTTNIAEHSAKFGMHISQKKTKITRTNQTPDSQSMYTGQAELKWGDHFTYLGSVISKDEDAEKEFNTRLAKAATVFRRLHNVRNSGSLGLSIVSTKLQLRSRRRINSHVPVYASEA